MENYFAEWPLYKLQGYLKSLDDAIADLEKNRALVQDEIDSRD